MRTIQWVMVLPDGQEVLLAEQACDERSYISTPAWPEPPLFAYGMHVKSPEGDEAWARAKPALIEQSKRIAAKGLSTAPGAYDRYIVPPRTEWKLPVPVERCLAHQAVEAAYIAEVQRLWSLLLTDQQEEWFARGLRKAGIAYKKAVEVLDAVGRSEEGGQARAEGGV